MKKAFDLKTWLGENRNVVISKYEELTKEEFFQGITLAEFMKRVLNQMANNFPKSENRAASLLPTILGSVYFDASNPSAHLHNNL